MTKWDGVNRRKFPRVNYPCLVVVRGGADQPKEVILTHTENIGVGGVCVILKQNLEMFCPVQLEIDMLDLGNHIKCQGKVVWNVHRKMDAQKKPLFYDIGIEFKDITGKDQERVDEVVKRLVKNHKETPYG